MENRNNQPPDRKTRNWKKYFKVLAIANGIVLLLLLLLIFLPAFSPAPEPPKEAQFDSSDSSEFTISSTKANVNELINAYIDKELNDNSDNYAVVLGDDAVELSGGITAFGIRIPLKMTLEPHVQENGDLILENKEISLGSLSLPNDKVLKYIDKYYNMPEWVSINPDEESIYVAVTQMELQNNLHVEVEQFNLPNDNLSFKLYVPNDTIGL
ncbi:YpmS family protein [Terribacillus sp. DMT04]|uniref:YpmS family protein n=1 Tax=Terribacillus sp. DMT04 TaxID=2850441 RepID=UPI001C2CB6AA|nr:YpmS family protein [Terribacillus sp. DMT04]QXE01226.1 YpmS family protein [Terribacillus sp. DMT04]